MSIDSFSTLWAARLFENWRHTPGVWRNLASDVSGLVNGANKVNLTNLDGSSITTGDYVQDTDITAAADTPTDTDATLELNQSKFQRIFVDDLAVAKTQFEILNNYAARGAEKMSQTIDSYIKTQILADVADTEKVDSGFLFPASISALTNAQAQTLAEELLQVAYQADVNHWPVADRRCVLSSAGKYAINRYLMNKGVNSSDTPKGAGLQSIESLLGMPVYLDSENLEYPDAANDIIAVFANSKALYFAQSINSVEVIRPENRFGDMVKWLSLYGSQKAFGSSDKNVIILRATAA